MKTCQYCQESSEDVKSFEIFSMWSKQPDARLHAQCARSYQAESQFLPIEKLPCFMCGDETREDDLSWCKTCQADICGQCDCGHDTWGA